MTETLTSVPKTATQIKAYSYLGNSGITSGVSYDYIMAYYNIGHTPTAAQTATLITNLKATLTSLSGGDYVALSSVIEAIELDFIGQDRLGNVNLDGPLDEVGVTYATLKAGLISALNNLDVSTAANLGSEIFYTIGAATPTLSLAALRADITATIAADSITASALAALIVTALGEADDTAAGIAGALYGNGLIIGSAGINLVADIIDRNKLINLNLMKAALITACEDGATDADGFAAAIYAVLTNLVPHPTDYYDLATGRPYWTVLTDLENAVASAIEQLDDLATVKAGMLSNLNSISSTATTADLIQDAVFADNAISPVNPYDFRLDVIAAQTLLNLQNIKTAILAACRGVIDNNNTAETFRDNLWVAFQDTTSTTFGTLTQAQLLSVINASVAADGVGTLATLAGNIYTQVNIDDNYVLTPSLLGDQLFGTGLLISSSSYDLTNDLIARQYQLNYSAMAAVISTAISGATDAAGIRDAIVNNIGSPSDLTNLLDDINAAIDNLGNIGTLKTNLATNLSAADSAEEIRDALFNVNSIISSHKYDLLNDIVTSETLRDYELIINGISAISVGSGTTALQYATAIRGVLVGLTGTPNLTAAALSKDIQAVLDSGTSITTLAGNINAALAALTSPGSYTAAGVKGALYNASRIISGNPMDVQKDADTNESQHNLIVIKNAIITACDGVTAGSPTITTASGFATALLAAIVSDSGMSSTNLTQDELTADITAAINAGTSLTAIASGISTIITGIGNNDLTAANISSSLYNAARIISSNPYEISLDITQAELEDYTTSIITSLTNALNIIAAGSDATTEYTIADLANAIFDSIVQARTGGTNLPTTQLKGAIAHTLSEDSIGANNFDSGVYVLAAQIVTNLASSPLTTTGITSAIFNSNAILSRLAQGDSADFLADLNTLHTGEADFFSGIRVRISSGLQNLSPGYTATDAATVIVNAIAAASPGLTIAELTADLTANGSLTATIGAIITSLENAANTASAIETAIYTNITTLATQDADALITDIGSSLAGSNHFGDLRDDLVTGIEGAATASALATALATVLHSLGDDFYINGQWLTSEEILGDINASVALSNLNTVKSGLVDNLNGLSGTDLSAAGIKGAIYANDALVSGNINAGVLQTDLGAVADAHSSLYLIQNDLNSVLSAAIIGSETVAEFSTNVVEAVTPPRFSQTPNLTAAKLQEDVNASDGNTASLAGPIYTAISALSGGGLTATGLKNGIFDNLTLGTVNANLLYDDVVTYATSRESGYYESITDGLGAVVELGDTYADKSALATALINELEAPSATLSQAELLADFTATSGSTVTQLRDCIRTNLSAISSPWTAANIKSVFYNTCITAVSANDENGLVTGLGTVSTTTLTYHTIADRIHDALVGLTSGYSSTDAATAIVRAVTPNAGATTSVTIAEMAIDIDYSVTLQETTLVALVNSIISSLSDLTSVATTANQVKQSVYYSTRVVDANALADHYGYDLVTVRDEYNSYTAVRTALASITGGSASAIVNSLLNTALSQASYATTTTQLENDFTDSVADYASYADLLSVLTARVSGADVSGISTAATNLRDAIYEVLLARNAGLLEQDLTSANDIDNYASLNALAGSGSYCRSGASHSVYRCTDSSTVGTLIATNDCSGTGFAMATSDCAMYSILGSPSYISYDGSTCVPIVDGVFGSCLAGLNYVSPS